MEKKEMEKLKADVMILVAELQSKEIEMEKLKSEIIILVAEAQGLKEIELILQIILQHNSNIDLIVNVNIEYDICDCVDELIEDNKLVAIEYYLPNMPYRLKRFLLPFGTNIK